MGASTGGSTAERDAKRGGLFGFAAGVTSIGAFVSSLFLVPPGPADQVLANFGSYRNQLIAAEIIVGLFAVLTIPFLLALANALKAKDNSMTSAATFLLVIGIVGLAFLLMFQISEASTLAAIYAAGGQNQAVAVVAANETIFGLAGPFNLAGLFAGVGLVFFGFAMIQLPLFGHPTPVKAFSNWVGVLGITLGVTLLIMVITEAATIAQVVTSFFLLSFWILPGATYLWRSGGSRPSSASSPA